MTRATQILVDVIALSLAFAAAFAIRFDGLPPAPMTGRLLLTGPYVVALEYALLMGFGIHRFAWRYVALKEAFRIGFACVVATILLVGARVVAGELQFHLPYLRHGIIPFGVLAINAALTFLGTTGVRVAFRVLRERQESLSRRQPATNELRTLLIGAGQAGVLVARELASRPDLGLKPVGFLDDDPMKLGSVISGIRVLGTTDQLPQLVKRHDAQQALISIANAPGSAIRRIRQLCDLARIPTKIIPGLYEIVGGKVNLARIRNVAIDDLLGREAVDLDLEAIAACVRHHVVLITGAGGSIGSELCRQICRFEPSSVVLVEQAEHSLFQIHRELREAYPSVSLVPFLGDVTDAARMREAFQSRRPAVVLHAAAHKHVPMVEWNAPEAIHNNVFGTKIVADLADTYDVAVFVLVSTDKAVNPSSVMGASKRAAEIYVQALSQQSKTRFVTVRFGNVLGSAGSVIPIFQEQIARGGPITITHPDMRRYFMTIPEACQLVLQAGTMGRGGEIFILDMGEPVKIVDLAKDLIALSGLNQEDIELRFTGVRPGEKLFEELSTDSELADKTRHPKIFVGRITPHTWTGVIANLNLLRSAVETQNDQMVLSALRQAVPEYSPAGDPRREELTISTPNTQRSAVQRAVAN